MRTARWIVAAVTAAALAAAGAIALVEIVAAGAGDKPVLVDWPRVVAPLARNPWSDTGPVVAGAALTAFSLVLLTLSFRRGHRGVLVLSGGPAGVDRFTSRRDLRTALRGTARTTLGVRRARVRTGRRGIRVRATLGGYGSIDPDRDLRLKLADCLDGFALAAPPALDIRITHAADGVPGGYPAGETEANR